MAFAAEAIQMHMLPAMPKADRQRNSRNQIVHAGEAVMASELAVDSSS